MLLFYSLGPQNMKKDDLLDVIYQTCIVPHSVQALECNRCVKL